MKQDIQLYIEGKRLDLFGDENIEITSSIQDVRDISKIFTDYSKSFSVPASSNNNKIFTHYYDSDLLNGYDARIRVESEIYINHELFRKGTIRLNKVALRDNQPYSYELVFFGSTVTLTRLLGDDKLKNLDLSDYNHEWTYNNVLNGLQTGLEFNGDSEAIIYPLISPKKRFIYDSDAGYDPALYPDNYANIGSALAEQGIYQQDLKPAIRLIRIIEAIEAKYSLTFSRDFFGGDLFNQLYMWMHREGGQISYAEGVSTMNVSNWTLNTESLPCSSEEAGVGEAFFSNDYFSFISTFSNIEDYVDGQAILTVTPDNLDAEYSYKVVDLVSDVTLFEETNIKGIANTTIDMYTPSGEDRKNWEIQLQISTSGSSGFLLYDADWYVRTYYIGRSGDLECMNEQRYEALNQNMIGEVIISNQTPDLKVIDFLAGLFKTFNLTAYVQDNVIVIDTLDNFYSAYENYDISKFVDVEKIDVERVELYSNINFKFRDAGTFLAVEFSERFDEDFGSEDFNVIIDNNYIDGVEYKIQLPFEKVIYERLVDANDDIQTNVSYGWFVSENEDKLKGNPLIFFNANTLVGSKNIYVRSSDGITSSTPSTYNRPSNVTADESQTLNFDQENDEFNLVYNKESLFKNFYKTYIEEIFDKQNRITKFEAYLPVDILTKYRLNDRFIVNRKDYKINKITTNLNSGKTQFELYNIIRNIETTIDCPTPTISISGYESGLVVDLSISSGIACSGSVIEWSQSSDFSSGVFTQDSDCSSGLQITLGSYGTWYFRAYIDCATEVSGYSDIISQELVSGQSFTSEDYTYDAVAQNACEGTPITLYKETTDGLYYDSDSGSGNLVTGTYYARLNSIYSFSSGIRSFFGYCEEYTAEIYKYNLSDSFVCDTQTTVTIYLNTTDGLYYNQPDPSASVIDGSFYSDGTRIYSFSNGTKSQVGFCNLFTEETYVYDAIDANVCDSVNTVTFYIDSEDGLYYDSNTGTGNLVTGTYYSDGSFIYSFSNGVRSTLGECDSYTLEVYKYDPILANVCDASVTENLYLKSSDGLYYDSDNGFGNLVTGSYYSINDNVYTMNNGVRTYIQACVGCTGGTLYFQNPIVTGMNATLQTGQLSYGTGECSSPLSLSLVLTNNEGEWNSASQVVSIQLFEGTNDVSGQYTLSNSLIGGVMYINIDGNFPDSFNDGDHTYQFRITAYNIESYTSTITLPPTNAVSHASVDVTANSDLPASRNGSFTNSLLIPVGEDGDAYEYTITYTADEGYEFTGLGNITQPLVTPSGVGVSATTGTYTSSTLTVIISGNIQASDVEATVSYSGSSIAQSATSVTLEFRYLGQSVWNEYPVGGIDIGTGATPVEVRITPDGSWASTQGNNYSYLISSHDPTYDYSGDAVVMTVYFNNMGGADPSGSSSIIINPRASTDIIGRLRFNYEQPI